MIGLPGLENITHHQVTKLTKQTQELNENTFLHQTRKKPSVKTLPWSNLSKTIKSFPASHGCGSEMYFKKSGCTTSMPSQKPEELAILCCKNVNPKM